MKLSILDQSPVTTGITASQALHNTLDLAQRADAWGYHRYWVAEHHGGASFASASPEIVMTRLAAATQRMRIGSGGILAPHYAPLKVAEVARSMEAFFPGRIDLGLGRAPGGDPVVTRALRNETNIDVEAKLRSILSYLADLRVPTPTTDVVAVPDGVSAPDVWILGTSTDSARLAARLGLRYAFGSFIDPTNMAEAFRMYWGDFVPSVWCTEPTTLIATVAFAAETERDARSIAACTEAWFVESFLRAKNVRFPSSTDRVTLVPTPFEQGIVEMRRRSVIYGDRVSARQQLEHLATTYATHEVAVVTITEHHEERLRSYELLAR